MKLLRYFFALALVLPVAGCEHGGLVPVKETYPKVQVETVKTLLGSAVKLNLTSDFTGNATGKMNKETGEYEFTVQVASNVSSVLPGYTQWGQQVWLPSQSLFNEWSQIQWNGVNTLMRNLEDFGAPLLSQYIGAWKDLGEAKLMRPTLTTQALSALMMANAGQTPINASFLWQQLGPMLQNAIRGVAPSAVPTSTQPGS